jgi:hypothetical protein
VHQSGSSVIIVSGYGPDDWAMEVRTPTEATDLPLTCVQTGCGVHQASCTMGTGEGPFSGG